MSIYIKTTDALPRALLWDIKQPFICTSCWQKRGVSHLQSRKSLVPHSPTGPSKRRATTIASVSAVNATKSIPDSYKELYKELSALGSKAAVYINLSQLQLALKSLESRDPVTRVALLNLNGRNGARQLASLLLADPLEPQADWERQLGETIDQDRRALLIRYGDAPEADQRHSIVRTISIPSTKLQRHKLEILISENASPEADVLVPDLYSPEIASSRSSHVTYPVHKTILYGEDLMEMTQILGRKLGLVSEYEKRMIQGMINATWRDDKKEHATQGPVFLNIGRAKAALVSFRKSLTDATKYGHGWLESGIPSAFDWLAKGLDSQRLRMKPVVASLIELLVERVEASIAAEQQQREYNLASSAVTDSVRHRLDARVGIWSARGHVELRDQLDIAFQTKNWGRLAWWKLLWHIDDVSNIADDVLQRSWLVNAEKEIIWVVGRIQEAGLINTTAEQHKNFRRTSTLAYPSLGSLPPPPSLPSLGKSSFSNRAEKRPFVPSNPWPQQISIARDILSSSTIPSLQAYSQRLLLQALSTTVISSMLSSLIYVSFPTTSIFEAGAIAAFGFMFSLRRLQTKWETTKKFWQGEVREEGRKVLNEVEEIARTAVAEGGKSKMDDVEIENRNEARIAVQRVKEALAKASQS